MYSQDSDVLARQWRTYLQDRLTKTYSQDRLTKTYSQDRLTKTYLHGRTYTVAVRYTSYEAVGMKLSLWQVVLASCPRGCFGMLSVQHPKNNHYPKAL